ncbi:MAG TPA: adenylate/guanylate cyclase domain-containing protein [Chloroflexota bacterium]|nr:adenylate/guanylate cyclase domain-containing protein [Chloroflexota bacterium]
MSNDHPTSLTAAGQHLPAGRALAPEALRETRHSLRTPLNHIIGYSEMLLESAADQGLEALVPDLERVHAAGQHLLEQLDRLLGPAQVAAGTVDPALLSLELRTPLNAVVGYTEILLEAAADRDQREAVLDLEKIHAASKHLLGLIDYVLDLSRIEAGALPAAPVIAPPESGGTAAATASAAAGTGADGEPALRTEHGSLLVVDDNALNRDVLARRLERLGYTVATAENGRQALAMLRAAPYDLVLLDILMPELDGYQVLRQLKADEQLRHIPVVVLSAIDELESVVRCVELGADDYLPKPFNPALLRARIGASLEKKRLRDQEVWYRQQIEAERQRADELLHVILPDEIVRELKTTDAVQPRRYEHVAVLFCDIVGFTPYCDQRQPQEVLTSLQQLVEVYEDLAARYEMQKIKTIGDAFMAVAGLLTPVENPVLNCVRCGLDMIAAAPRLTAEWTVRVGVHVGPVVAGVLGRRQYLFDLWGDTVNTAARMESSGVAGTVTLSRAAWDAVATHYPGERVGAIPVKGKGDLEVFRIAPG